MFAPEEEVDFSSSESHHDATTTDHLSVWNKKQRFFRVFLQASGDCTTWWYLNDAGCALIFSKDLTSSLKTFGWHL